MSEGEERGVRPPLSCSRDGEIDPLGHREMNGISLERLESGGPILLRIDPLEGTKRSSRNKFLEE